MSRSESDSELSSASASASDSEEDAHMSTSEGQQKDTASDSGSDSESASDSEEGSESGGMTDDESDSEEEQEEGQQAPVATPTPAKPVAAAASRTPADLPPRNHSEKRTEAAQRRAIKNAATNAAFAAAAALEKPLPPSQLINKNIAQMPVDYYYHLGLSSDMDLKSMFGDVRFVILSGSPVRALETISKVITALDIHIPLGCAISPIGKTERYSLYKAGPVMSVSHGMGKPSISIMLHEITKLLAAAGVIDKVTYIRVGTSGGLGCPPGTVVVSSGTVNGSLEPSFPVIILGETVNYPCRVQPQLVEDIMRVPKPEEAKYQIIKGVTCATDDFYEGQARLDGAICEYTLEDKMAFIRRAHDAGVRNIEMESDAIVAFCTRLNIRCAVICCTIVDRLQGDQVNSTPAQLVEFTDNAVQVTLRFIQQQLKFKPGGEGDKKKKLLRQQRAMSQIAMQAYSTVPHVAGSSVEFPQATLQSKHTGLAKQTKKEAKQGQKRSQTNGAPASAKKQKAEAATPAAASSKKKKNKPAPATPAPSTPAPSTPAAAALSTKSKKKQAKSQTPASKPQTPVATPAASASKKDKKGKQKTPATPATPAPATPAAATASKKKKGKKAAATPAPATPAPVATPAAAATPAAEEEPRLNRRQKKKAAEDAAAAAKAAEEKRAAEAAAQLAANLAADLAKFNPDAADTPKVRRPTKNERKALKEAAIAAALAEGKPAPTSAQVAAAAATAAAAAAADGAADGKSSRKRTTRSGAAGTEADAAPSAKKAKKAKGE